MYPQRELTRLAARKALVQARIELRRWECAQAAAQLSRPIALIDRGIALWRRISPFVKLMGLPAALLGARKILRHTRGGKWTKLAAMLPAILRGAKVVMQMRAAHNGTRARSGAMP
jgi:hypothetical protein